MLQLSLIIDDVTASSAIILDKVTSDPCTASPYAEGAIFYNDTSDYPCYCDASNNDLKISDDSACF